MFEKIALSLDGISGYLIDRGEAGAYWEGTLEPTVIQQFSTNKRYKPVTVHINGEAAGYGVIQQCWFNLEQGSILVRFLHESPNWHETFLTQPKRRREDRDPVAA